MIGAAAAYMAGLFFASFFTSSALIVVFTALIMAVVIVGRRYGFKLIDYTMMSAFFAAAFIVFNVYTAATYEKSVAMDGHEGSFEGEVVSAAHYSGDNSSYILKGSINGDIPAKVNFYANGINARLGDTLSFGSCTFSRYSKDYFFDSERYYRSEGVFLSLNNAEDIVVIPAAHESFGNRIADYREHIISDFRIRLGGDSGDFLAGMVFGEKRGMDGELKTAVYRCGIGHVLAVSGLHVSVAVLVLMSVLRMCHVNKFVSFAVMEALIIFITTLANYPVSAIRAAIMMNFLYAASLFRRQNDSFNSLAGAVLIICVFQPYAVYDEGFILSVAGTFGIAVFAPYMTKNMPRDTMLQKLAVNSAIMLCTTVCVLPFTLLFFDETSLVSPLTNIMIVPFCSVSMVIGLIYALTAGVVDILPIAKVINDFVLHFSDAAARIRFTHFACGSRTVTAGLMICAAFVFLTAAVFRNKRYICASVCASLLFLFIGSTVWRIQRNDKVIVAVLGKGNKAALVISSGGTSEVIDISGHYRSAAYVKKYLTRNDINSVGAVVLMDKINSSFASYRNKLAFTDIGKWLAVGENELSSDGNILFTEDKTGIMCGACTVYYDKASVCVSCFGKTVCIADKISSLDTEYDIAVICGNAPDNSASYENIVFIDGDNNFEVELSESDGFKIRRM